MKAVKIIIAMLLCGSVYGQTVTPNPGPYQNINTKYQYTWQKWSGGIWNAGKLIQTDSAQFMGPVYVPMAPAGDSSTLAANTAWVRRWITDSVAPGVPGTPTPTWNYRGNYTDADPTNGRLGFKDSADLHFMTNNIIRATIPAAGIERNSGAANKVVVIDTVTKLLYYSDAGTGGSIDTTNLHGRGVAYYQLEGDSAVLTLNDSSKYSVAIGGGGGAEKYITAGYGVTVDSSVANVYEVGVDTATVLEITNPRPAYHIFGNHTGSSAAPTWGKLNVNSIDATGTPGSGNFLRGDGSWQTVSSGVTTMAAIGATPNANGASITGTTFNLQPASASFGGVVTTGTQSFAGVKNFGSRVNVNGATDNNGYQLNVTGTIRASGLVETASNFGSFGTSSSFGGFVFGSGPNYNGIAANFLGTYGWLKPATGSTPLYIMQDVANGTFSGSGFMVSYYTSSSPTALTGVTATGTPNVGLFRLNTAFNTYGNAANPLVYDGLKMAGSVVDAYGTRPVTYNLLNINPTFSSGLAATTARAIYYNPVLTVTPSTHIAFQNTAGNNAFNSTSGSTVIGGTTPAASAKLEVQSTTTGFLPPRMTQAQRDAISSPADGLIIFCTDCTATDASTGVSQTYSSSAWRNHY